MVTTAVEVTSFYVFCTYGRSEVAQYENSENCRNDTCIVAPGSHSVLLQS